ncbi:unnamed protein product [Gulo gulo]|uniref:Uncharacterized protein n=1 Tax=Gulo gulo TaxID=48420 RepID=A0A9X9Q7I9_GULGU|nr:unnamed protein product [Gulo gulo]
MRSTARLPVGLRSPARGANHLCHTVTIILHKIIIKNPNFSASNPASGLLAFFSAGVCRPVITALITSGSGVRGPGLWARRRIQYSLGRGRVWVWGLRGSV